ncbi:unnamed protein product [Phytophthora fragariaefolia]|uniref:Unnamed protein product n=1 Tax=Phytophthora fragariaefolia TaxID=1490495 RepID=A0A9W7CKT0_9STRA|nr:unnamed protein product [Phytophthora fragariaefolia]
MATQPTQLIRPKSVLKGHFSIGRARRSSCCPSSDFWGGFVLRQLVVYSTGQSWIGPASATVMTVEPGGLGCVQARASPSSGQGASSRAPLDGLAAAAARAPRAPLSSPSTAPAALLDSLPPTDDFDFDPGLIEPFLLLDDEGVLVDSRGTLSPAPARVPDGDEDPSRLVDLDAILAESDDVIGEEVVDQAAVLASPALPPTIPGIVASSPVDGPVRMLQRLRMDPPSSPPSGPTLRSATATVQFRRSDVEASVVAPVEPSPPVETQMVVYHDEPLPQHPARHPANNHRNYYDSEAPWDPTRGYGFSYFLDRHGDSPNRS